MVVVLKFVMFWAHVLPLLQSRDRINSASCDADKANNHITHKEYLLHEDRFSPVRTKNVSVVFAVK